MKNKFAILFEIINFILMGTILVVSVTGTYSHIAWYKVILVACVWMLCFFAAYCILKKGEALLIKHKHRILSIVLILFLVLLSIFSIYVCNTPINDYGNVYNDSKLISTGGEVDWPYYAMFKNNYMLLLLMAAIRYPAIVLGFEGFYLTVIFSSVCAVFTAFIIFKILEQFRLPIYMCFFSLLVYISFLPIWGCTYAFYSDQATLLLTVLPFYLLTKKESTKHDLHIFRSIVAGLLIGMAFWLKATAIIPIIACVIAFVLHKKDKLMLKKLLFAFGAFALFMLCFELAWKASPSSKMTDIHLPFIYWVALGARGDGGYVENRDFVNGAMSVLSVQAKKDYALMYIKEHSQEMFSLTHLVRKTRHNFASGFMGLSTYIYDGESPAFPFMNAYGKYGGYAMMLSTGMLYLLVFFNVAGSVLPIIKKQDEDVSFLSRTARLSLFGLFIFLMFWEANNRQLYNHIPWFVISGVCSLYQLMNLRKKEERKLE